MITIAIICVTFAILYFYSTRNFNYWKKRGVKHEKPLPFFGNNLKGYIMQESISQLAVRMYWKYPNEKVVGMFRASEPELIIRDPAIIKRILTTDFGYFYSRGLNHHNVEVEPMSKNLFFLDGDVWRLLRQRMTPAFTSGKLKAMFPLIVERAENLQTRTSKAAAAGLPLDARDLMARYTTDFIGAVGFGLDSDSLSDEESPFRKLGAEIFQITVRRMIVAFLKDIFPHTFQHLKFQDKVEPKIIDLVNQIQEQRNYQPSRRNDFIDLMLECKKLGVMTGESMEKFNKDGTPVKISLEMDDVLLAAQVFVFFAAGFETSSSATSFTLHQLAYHPDVQKKVQEDIDKVLEKHNNKLSYDAVKEMTYLEWAFKEGMRMFPSLGFLIRESTGKYTILETDVTIEKGVRVFIPLQALHNDPEYFEEPHVFRPERFHPDEYDSNKLKHVYLPFGEGPRACIGERLGLMQSLAGLAAVLSKFTVEPAPQTLRHPISDPGAGIVQTIKGGLPLMFKERTV